MLIFGMGLSYLYLMTVVGSFCLFMSSFSFMKVIKIIPEYLKVFWFCVIFSVIPILNMFFSIIFLIFSLKIYYDPEFRKNFPIFKEVKNKIERKKFNEEK